jgi:putative intracellular protease/amidase
MVTTKTKPQVRMLLLVGDRVGANCMMGGKKLSILEKFSRFGWEVTLAGVEARVEPCPFAAKRGAETMMLDTTVDAIHDVLVYDGVCVLPGTSFQGLIASDAAMRLLREGHENGLVVSGWCRGVGVLAEAGILQGKQVVGHEDDRGAIEDGGGVFVGQDHPPIIDGTVVTGARSYHYRAKNADAIRQAILARQTR